MRSDLNRARAGDGHEGAPGAFVGAEPWRGESRACPEPVEGENAATGAQEARRERARRTLMPVARPATRRSNATKPPKFLWSVSVSTRIRSASVLAAFRRPLRRRTSSRHVFLERSRLAPFPLRTFRTSELLVARPSSLPSTCTHHKCSIAPRARGATRETPLLHKNFQFSTMFRSIPRFPHTRRGRPGLPVRPR